jgi:flagellar hook assembly protein FlgD
VTTLNNAYPNPFRANNSTKIEVGIKAGESGTLTIYNIRGEIVKAIKVNEGYHTIIWDGKDSKGNVCGSGIYFYKLTTPSLNQTKKMVIVK